MMTEQKNGQGRLSEEFSPQGFPKEDAHPEVSSGEVKMRSPPVSAEKLQTPGAHWAAAEQVPGGEGTSLRRGSGHSSLAHPEHCRSGAGTCSEERSPAKCLCGISDFTAFVSAHRRNTRGSMRRL